MKPEDIPQEVRKAAEDALRSANIKAHMLGEPTDPIECISLAIMSAEKRGEEREPESCAEYHDELAEKHRSASMPPASLALLEFHSFRAIEHSKYAAAIRNRGKP